MSLQMLVPPLIFGIVQSADIDWYVCARVRALGRASVCVCVCVCEEEGSWVVRRKRVRDEDMSVRMHARVRASERAYVHACECLRACACV